MDTKIERLLAICKFNSKGKSRWITREEMDSKVFLTETTNGRNYTFIRTAGYNYEWSSTKEIRIFKTSSGIKSNIPSKVRDKLKDAACVVTGLKEDIQIDHKVGREEDADWSSTDEDLYQPLYFKINYKKREYCNKVCKTTDKRFDARSLGYSKGWEEGGEDFEGSCKGCYYYDIAKFRSEL